MAKTGLYTGYVVQSEPPFNPVKVWVPKRNQSYFFGFFRFFGENTGGNIGLEEYYTMLNEAEDFYLTSELTSGSNGLFDTFTGNGTGQDNVSDFTKIQDLTTNKAENISHTPSQSTRKQWHSAQGADSLVQTSRLSTLQGTTIDAHMNQPKGNFANLTVGTRVLVGYVDDGTLGVILRQFPDVDSTGKVLYDLNNLKNQ